jgi:hypothetical protein
MFIQLYRGDGGVENGDPKSAVGQPQPGLPARRYLEAHPFVVASLMELLWALRNRNEFQSDARALPFLENIQNGNYWPWHLIYAYMIENTRIYEIFEKVILEYFHGEKLGFPRTRPGTNRWLRTAEELFFKSSSNYLVNSFVSNIRSDVRSSRRNAYYRMFGLDLNHGTGTAANYPYQKPVAANKDFVPLFEELLSEVWLGITNWTNQIGPNPTDDSRMADLIRRLNEMLNDRRQEGNLRRDEFLYVATMSWMHLTLYVDDYDVISDMGISAQSPGERLRQMGEKVGLPAHPKADAFFQMAEALSTILICIEHMITPPGLPPAPIIPQNFYALGAPLRQATETVITHWSIATGRDLKSLKTRSSLIGVPAPRRVEIAAPSTVGMLIR